MTTKAAAAEPKRDSEPDHPDSLAHKDTDLADADLLGFTLFAGVPADKVKAHAAALRKLAAQT